MNLDKSEIDRVNFTREYLQQALHLYAVTDRAWLGDETLRNQVELALKGGVTFVQLREKKLNHADFLAQAFEIKELCREYNVPFVINDNVQIALECDADGVHVGQSDMELIEARKILGAGKIIGVSAQTVEQAVLAEKQGADYLGVGAVFSTNTKLDADYVPPQTLKQICSSVKIPVVAIGGITLENVKQLAGSGIAGISVISAIFAQKDIKLAAEELNETMRRYF